MIYFETIKCYDFIPFNLDYHKKRISNTIALNIDLEEYIYPPSEELLKCKVIFDNTGILNIEFSPYTKKEISSFKIIYDDKITYNKKSIDRSDIDSLYNLKLDCDEIIIMKNSFVTDTSIANIAILYDGEWLTPKSPLLYGTTRARYIDNGILKEKDITIDMLKSSDKIALLNAMIDFDIKTNFDIIE